MHSAITESGRASAIPIWFVSKTTWPGIRDALDEPARAFAGAAGYEPKPGSHLVLPAPDGGIAAVLFGLEDEPARANPLLPGNLPGLLPEGSYRFANAPHDMRLAALAFALG